MVRKGVVLLCMVFAAATAGAQPEQAAADRTAAEQVWQRMLAAKGDASSVRALRITTMRSSLFALKPEAVQVVMTQLPEHWWWYFEEPKPLWDGLRVLDLRKGTGWEWGASQQHVEKLDGRHLDWGAVIEARTLAVLFGALGEFQPEPISTEVFHEDFAIRDRVTLRWRDYTLVYDLDRKSHLPIRVDMQRMLPTHDHTAHPLGKEPVTRHFPERVSHEVYVMAGYHMLGSVMVPSRVQSFGVWSRWVVDINPPLDPILFTEEPRTIAGAAGWHRFAGTQ